MHAFLKVLLLGALSLCALSLPAVQVTVNPGNFTGSWDIALDGNFAPGTRTLDLAVGTHRIRPGTTGELMFTVDASGLVTMDARFDGVSAQGGAGTLTFLTIPPHKK